MYRRTAAGTGREEQQFGEPLGPRAVQIALRFGKVQRQMVRHEAVLEPHLPQGDLLVGIGHLLQVLMPGHERIEIPLRRPVLQQMQNDLRVLRIVLVPRVVQGLSRAGDGNRRHQAEMKPGLPEDVGQRPMVVAGRLERDLARQVEAAERRDEAVDLGLGVRDAQRTSLAARQLQQHLMRQLRNVDRYPHAGDVVEDFEVMAGSLLWSELWQTHSREALVLP